MIRAVKQVFLEKSVLAAENTTSILSLVSILFAQFTTFVSIHPWGIELNIPLIIFLSLAGVGTISLDIWFRFKPIFPKFKTPKVRKVKYLIYGIAMLTALVQSGTIAVLIVDDLEKINANSLPSYTDEYRIISLMVYEIVVPILYVYLSNKIVKEIESNNKRKWYIMEDLGWR